MRPSATIRLLVLPNAIRKVINKHSEEEQELEKKKNIRQQCHIQHICTFSEKKNELAFDNGNRSVA